jgi:hypothetical protein
LLLKATELLRNYKFRKAETNKTKAAKVIEKLLVKATPAAAKYAQSLRYNTLAALAIAPAIIQAPLSVLASTYMPKMALRRHLHICNSVVTPCNI